MPADRILDSLGNAYAMGAGAGAGFDWLLIDGEHSPIGVESTLAMLQAAAGYPISPVVRPAANDAVMIKRALHIGAQTLLVPFVESALDSRAAVEAMRYPLRGRRGVGGGTVRATRFGRVAEYATRAEESLCLLVQAETRRSLENLEEIAREDGVDGVFIGPADLAADLGFPGQPGHPEVQRVIENTVSRVLACGKELALVNIEVSQVATWTPCRRSSHEHRTDCITQSPQAPWDDCQLPRGRRPGSAHRVQPRNIPGAAAQGGDR